MKAFVRHIGLIDHDNRVHAVTFLPGVNVITGKSSTGKSALIEIFDYCFGSSDYTIPQGVITRSAAVYFTVMRIKGRDVVLARRYTAELKNKGFVADLASEDVFSKAEALKLEFFADNDFIPLDEFKKEVGKRFGLVFTDVDEDREARLRRPHQKRAPSPSIRSFTSFMLQHQNLVANKHAIFYRFDQKEKRDQAIEHFKSFVGFATPEYFQLKQELGVWENQLKALEGQLPKAEEAKSTLIKSVETALANYSAASGTPLVATTPEQLIAKPAKAISLIRDAVVRVDGASVENERLRTQLSKDHSILMSKKRDASQQLRMVRQSIEHINHYRERAVAVPTPKVESITVSTCPFCASSHSKIEAAANKLDEAIRWLNNELDQSTYLPESLVEDEAKLQRDIEKLNSEIQEVQSRLAKLDQQDAELANKRSNYELAVKAKVQVEAVLEKITEDQPSALKLEIQTLAGKIKERKEKLKRDYDVEAKLLRAEGAINQFMGLWGEKFDFEPSFKPIKLQFSLESFDLWHKNPDGVEPKKVFLRSMGSGANWLYSHLTLFMALHHYFSERGDECLIPPILFLDQPSQVYFPAVLDTSEEFNAKEIKKKESEADPEASSRAVDDDLAAVSNFYSRMVEFCSATKATTGYEPQIIVTDHADKLDLSGDTKFESLVRGRWRNRGLIDLNQHKHPESASA